MWKSQSKRESRGFLRRSSTSIINLCFEAISCANSYSLQPCVTASRDYHGWEKNIFKMDNRFFVWFAPLSLGGLFPVNRRTICSANNAESLSHTHISLVVSFTQLLSVIAVTHVILLIMSFLCIRRNFMLEDSCTVTSAGANTGIKRSKVWDLG